MYKVGQWSGQHQAGPEIKMILMGSQEKYGPSLSFAMVSLRLVLRWAQFL